MEIKEAGLERNILRVIPRLDIKWPHLIKTIQLEGLRKMGDPKEYALKYYNSGADEIVFNDCVASLYGRNSLLDLVSEAADSIFVPLTVGGGIRSVDDARNMLRAGADRVFINTGAIKNKELLNGVANLFGSQALVVHIEAKKIEGKWFAFYDNGRENSGIEVLGWAQECISRGCGEILLTSVDNEGTSLGYDFELLEKVLGGVDVPVVASGGLGRPEHAVKAYEMGCSGVAIAGLFHYSKYTIDNFKSSLNEHNIPLRF